VLVEPFGGNNEDVLGSFPDIRAATWNFRFKNTMRRFARGDRGLIAEVATRFAGSSDLLQAAGFGPLNGVSYITSHDGFTLSDLVSYASSHNEANGEASGDSDNLSSNCGSEGPTSDAAVETLRSRTIRNCFALLLLSQGVPMILAGDECRRTQHGNNNPYLQDNELIWFDWSLVERNAELVDLVRFLVDFRKRHPALRRSEFFRGEPSQRGLRDIEFHGCELNAPGFGDPSSAVLAVTIADSAQGEDIFVIFNMESSPLAFQLPHVIGRSWYRALDTALAAPAWSAPGAEAPIRAHDYVAPARSVVVLVSKP
ncbi:MAG TPA: glycogen debranching enzyme GlgX, partial [Polyangiaceae bacterium]